MPVKGINAQTALNLQHFSEQDYPGYELIVALASKDDPAYSQLSDQMRRSNGRLRIVVAGYSDVRGEKVNNLLAGLAAVRKETEVLVFADADARPGRDWLRTLVAPLADPALTVSSGFRWYLPGPGFVSRLRAAWDTSIATLLGDHDHNFAWGGSMALRVAEFTRLRIAERYWAHVVSDDYAVTRAVREAGGKIRFEPRCLLASHEDSPFGIFFRWTNRQIIITRIYAEHLWRMGLAAHLLYGVTILFGLVLMLAPSTTPQNRIAVAGILAVILALGLLKGRIRSIIARDMFPEERASLDRYGRCYWQLAPVVPWIMLLNFLIAGFTRRIEWSGTHYELVSRDEVKVLRRGG